MALSTLTPDNLRAYNPATTQSMGESGAGPVAQDTNLGNNVLAGLASGGNSLLFGIPAFALSRLGITKKSDIDQYFAKHKTASTIGDVAGNIGSAFLPGLGLVGKAGKAAEVVGGAAKAAKAAEAIKDAGFAGGELAKTVGTGLSAVAKATPIAEKTLPAGQNILNLAGKGALYGGAEGAVRGLTGSEQGKELQGAAQGAQQGAAFGALGGGVMGGLSAAAPKIAGILKKGTEKAVIGTTDAKARQLLQMVQEMTPAGSGPGYKLAHSDKLRGDFVDFIKQHKLWKEGAVESAYESNKAIWDNLDKTFDGLVGNKKASEILAGALTPEDTAEIVRKYGPEIAGQANDAVMKAVGNNTGMYGIREGLKNIRDFARKAVPQKIEDQYLANAMHDIASSARANLDDAVVKAAESSGANIPPTFKRDWGFLQPLEKGTLKADWTPAAGAPGSPTFEKAMVSSMLPGGIVGFASGNQDTDIGTRMTNAAIGSLGGLALAKGIGRLGVKGGALADTLMGKLKNAAPAIAANAPTAAAIGGGLGSLAAQSGQPEAPEAVADVAKQSDAGSPEHDEMFRQRLMQGLNLSWMRQTQGLYGEPSMDNPVYRQFIQGAEWALKDNGQSKVINPRLAANILFQNPDQKAAYLKALEAQNQITNALPGAAQGILGPAQGIVNPQAASDKGAILDAAKGITGGSKSAEGAINRVLMGNGSKQDKLKKILSILRPYNPVAFDALSLAGQT